MYTNDFVLFQHGSKTPLDMEASVITLENKRVMLQSAEDFTGSQLNKFYKLSHRA